MNANDTVADVYIHGQESSLAPPPPTTSSSLPKDSTPYVSTFVNLNILLTGGHSGESERNMIDNIGNSNPPQYYEEPSSSFIEHRTDEEPSSSFIQHPTDVTCYPKALDTISNH
uniref:Uncharacterized protein n=1 Tax=Glossina pallidipes TaxID=7398 RepID=A0A1B0A254_GLOPL